MESLLRRRFGGLDIRSNKMCGDELEARMALLKRDRTMSPEMLAGEKVAMFGFGKSEAAKKKGHAEATFAFDGLHNDYDALHPMPKKTVAKWRSELNHNDHHEFHHGYNHFSDHFNKWLGTTEGETWNEAQAAKYNAKEASALFRGFDKQATVFSIPHGDKASSTMAKLRHFLGKPAIAKK